MSAWTTPTVEDLGPRPRDNHYFAEQCVNVGLAVFPCGDDKKPYPGIRWREMSTTDITQISIWWSKQPKALPAIDLAKSGHLVIDGDRHGGPDGVAAFDELIADHHNSLFEVLPIIITPSDGRHYYFKQPDGETFGNGRGTLPDGIDVRGHGGYVIAPGAQLPDGRRYRRDQSVPNIFRAIQESTVPVLPEWLAELLRPNGHDRTGEKGTHTVSTPGEPTDRYRAYAHATLTRLCDELAGMAEGRRNTELNNAAVRMGHMVASGWIDRAEVEHELEAAGMACGLNRTEIRATLRSGLEKGLEEPCREPEDRPRPKPGTQPAAKPSPSTDKWRDHVFTAASLKDKKFDPISYAVPTLYPEGITILAGRPKVGKSWLALDIALAIAGAFYLLGNLKPEQGDVLYAALEDNQRRLRSRIDRILSGSGQFWPPRLTLATKWRRLDQGGVADAREWAASVEQPRLMIFDTLAGVRPDRNNRDTLYEGDYKALTELQAWAGESGLSGLILTHTRKMDAEDPIDSVSGTLGITGCVDTVSVLARTGNGPTLYVRGRDVEEQEKAILFNKSTCRWTIRGDAEEVHQSEIRQKIVAVLANSSLSSQPMGPKEIANLCDVRDDAVRQRLPGMVEAGQIIQVSRGLYIAASRVDLLPTKPRHNRHNVTMEGAK